jgi:hypothetical protein
MSARGIIAGDGGRERNRRTALVLIGVAIVLIAVSIVTILVKH